MKQILDAFWRALAYCLHPRVIGLSLFPLGLMLAASFGLVYFFWQPAVASVQAWLDTFRLYQALAAWLNEAGWSLVSTMLAPLLVLSLSTPVIVVASLLLVATFMTSAMAALVGQRRFPMLERKRGASMVLAVWWSLWSTVVALVALLLSMPLWLVPPLVLILPPLIWGWLTYRVFAFDALAAHASKDERQHILREHRGRLLLMGVLTGYLGAAPSLFWASGALFLAFAPLLVPLAIWVYTLVFALSSLWFAHYLLAELARLRSSGGLADADDPMPAHGAMVDAVAWHGQPALPAADTATDPSKP